MTLSLYDLNKDKPDKSLATHENNGLMSSIDKIKLDLLDYYVHPATHPVTMITGLATVATTGSYNDLLDKPTVSGGGTQIGDDLTLKNLTVTEQTNIYNLDINEQGSFAFGEMLTADWQQAELQKVYTTFTNNQMPQSFIIVNNTLYAGTGVGFYGQGGDSSITGELYSLEANSTTWVKKVDRYNDYSTIYSMASIGNIIYAIALNINNYTSVLLSYNVSSEATTWTLESEALPNSLIVIATLDNIIYGIDNTEGCPLYAFNTALSAPIMWESLIVTPISDRILSLIVLNGIIYASTYLGKLLSFTIGTSAWVELATAYNYNGEDLLTIMPLTVINDIIYGTTFSDIDNHCILLSFNPTLSTTWKLENVAPLVYGPTPIVSFAVLNNDIYAISSQFGAIYKFIVGNLTTTSEVISMGRNPETFANIDMYYAAPIIGFNNYVYIGAYIKNGAPSPNIYYMLFPTTAKLTFNDTLLYGTVDANNLVINGLSLDNLAVSTLITNNMNGDIINLGTQIIIDNTLTIKSGYTWKTVANTILDYYESPEGITSLIIFNGVIYAGAEYGRLLSFTPGISTAWNVLALRIGYNNNIKLVEYQGILYAAAYESGEDHDRINIFSYTPEISTAWDLVLTTSLDFSDCNMEIYIISGVIYGVCVRDSSTYNTELYSFTIGESTDWTLICSLTNVLTMSSLALNGKIYIGTLNPGKLYSFTPGDTLFTLRADAFEGVYAITALTSQYDRIYAGAGFGCKLLYFDPAVSTSWELIADTLPGDSVTNAYPLALISNDSGNIYCATTGATNNGHLYISSYNDPWNKMIKNSPPSEVITKMVFYNGTLYATSLQRGDLYTFSYTSGVSHSGTEILSITNTKLTINGDLEVTGDIIGFSSGGTGTVSSLTDLGITATSTEINYLSGITSNIKNQFSTLVSTDSNLQNQINIHNHDDRYALITHTHDGESGIVTTLSTLGVTATADELNILNGVVGINSTEIMYLDGLTGNIQEQISTLAANGGSISGDVTVTNLNVIEQTNITDVCINSTITFGELTIIAGGIEQENIISLVNGYQPHLAVINNVLYTSFNYYIGDSSYNGYIGSTSPCGQLYSFTPNNMAWVKQCDSFASSYGSGPVYAINGKLYSINENNNLMSYTPGVSTSWTVYSSTSIDQLSHHNGGGTNFAAIGNTMYAVPYNMGTSMGGQVYAFDTISGTNFTACIASGNLIWLQKSDMLALNNKIYILEYEHGDLYSYTPGDTALVKVINNNLYGGQTFSLYHPRKMCSYNGKIYATMENSINSHYCILVSYDPTGAAEWTLEAFNDFYPGTGWVQALTVFNSSIYAITKPYGDLYKFTPGVSTQWEILNRYSASNKKLYRPYDMIECSGKLYVITNWNTTTVADGNNSFSLVTGTPIMGISCIDGIINADTLNITTNKVTINSDLEVTGDIIGFSGGGIASLTDLGIIATASEINILDGVTGVTSTEINYLSGTTSNIQNQISTLVSTDVNLQQQISTLATGTSGVDIRKLLYHSNKCANSSFELFDFVTNIPLYWSTEGVISEDSNFDGNYSLKLTYQQSATQKAEVDGGLWNPSWWSGYPNTRISFRCKKVGASGALYVYVKDSNDVLQNVTYSNFNPTSGKWIAGVTDTYLQFTPGNNWVDGFFTFTVACATNDYHRIEFYNNGSSDLYIDAVTIEPDIGDSGPSIYRTGIKSTGSIDIGGKRLYISSEDPINVANNGDVWIDIS